MSQVRYEWLSVLPPPEPKPFDDDGWQKARDRRQRRIVNIAVIVTIALALNAVSFAVAALFLS